LISCFIVKALLIHEEIESNNRTLPIIDIFSYVKRKSSAADFTLKQKQPT